MPILLDDDNIFFPDHSVADEFGILAVGGDLSAQRVLAAYYQGIFPWPHAGLPLLWFSPDPRFVMSPSDIVMSHSLAKILKKTSLVVKADTNFRAVIKGCQGARHKQKGTWITKEIINAYEVLHRMGYAHSIEAYRDDQLVGGLYGMSIGSLFFGESMYFLESNASKIAFVTLVAHLLQWNFSLIDCQSHTQHLESFGAYSISRTKFLEQLAISHQSPTRLGPWTFHLSPHDAYRLIKTSLP